MKLNHYHFEIFCYECSYWIKFFGIYDYRISYFLIDDKNDKGLAGCKEHSDQGSKVFQIYLYKNGWKNDKPTKRMLRETAFHEVMEILMYGMREHLPQCNADWYIHTHIRIMENTVFKESYFRRYKEKEIT
jgi:hypothetical protein